MHVIVVAISQILYKYQKFREIATTTLNLFFENWFWGKNNASIKIENVPIELYTMDLKNSFAKIRGLRNT